MNLLACDLGGTKIIIGIYTFQDSIKKLYQNSYKSNEWDDFYLLIENFYSTLPKEIIKPEFGCIGVAGHVNNGEVKVTNLGWILNENKLRDLLNLKKLTLINDFSVMIYGIPFIKESQYIPIQFTKTKVNSNSNSKLIALIGAGTGLGIARGLITNKKIYALPSEGGHREFSPRSDQEWEFCKWIKKDLGINRVSIERVVSGNGLKDIARWRLNKTDARNHPLNVTVNDTQLNKSWDLAESVTHYAKNGDEIMTEVLELWLSAYGSAVGDLALQELCTSGLWIAGGIAAKISDSIKSMTFINALREKGRFSVFIESIPINLLIDQQFGLFSSACKAHLISESSKNII